MANYRSEVASGRRSVAQPSESEVEYQPVDVVLTTTLVANDIIDLIDLPPGVKLVHYKFIAPQLDSNGTPTLAFSFGEIKVDRTDILTAYETALTIGRGADGNVVSAANAKAAQVDSSANRKIGLKVTTAAATAAQVGKTFTVLLGLRG